MKKIINLLLVLFIALSLAGCSSTKEVSAEAQGFGGKVKVTLKVDGETIKDVKIEGNDETPDIGQAAFEALANSIKASNGTKIDVVSGATVTSNAVSKACEKALKEAKGETQELVFNEGTFEGVAKGRNGDIKVNVTTTKDGVDKIDVVEHTETYGVGYGMETTPIELITKEVVRTQSLNVDAVSGATITSSALKAAITNALENGNMDAEILDKEYVSEEKVDSEYNVDVVVVGAGVAGLTSAISAATNGSNVLLLEKVGITGGSTTVSGGKTLAAGTKWQEAQGIKDTPQDLYNYMTSLGNSGNEEIVKLFAENTAGAIDWMEANGVKFQDVERTHISIPTWRVHNDLGSGWMLNGKGGEIIVPLTNKASELGVNILYNTPATDLILEDGAVVGVKASHKGQEVIVKANNVILATGGFTNNQELLAISNERWGLDECFVSSAGVGTTGDGHIMAENAGAVVDYSVGPSYTYVSFTCGAGINEEAGLIVSEDGKRVVNEYSYQYNQTAALVNAGSSKAFYIADQDDVNPMIQYGMSLENTPKADSPEELAKLIGIDSEVLKETIETYNEYCRNGVDEEFGKPKEFLNELTGTLYAIQYDRSMSFTFGGIKTNEKAEAINADGNPIKGLYAVGECAFYSLLGVETEVNYPSCGTAIADGVVFGIIAGEEASK